MELIRRTFTRVGDREIEVRKHVPNNITKMALLFGDYHGVGSGWMVTEVNTHRDPYDFGLLALPYREFVTKADVIIDITNACILKDRYSGDQRHATTISDLDNIVRQASNVSADVLYARF